jgi:hypothetical protein
MDGGFMNSFVSWSGAILSRHPDYEHHPLAIVVGCLAAISVSLFGIAAWVAAATGALISYGEAIACAVVLVIVVAGILATIYEMEHHRHRPAPQSTGVTPPVKG